MVSYRQFPLIKHISDVLPVIQGRKEFIVAEKPGMTIINYVVNSPDTFPAIYDEGGEIIRDHTILRECRGIKFDSKTGEIISRPYHKFFNLGEKADAVFDFTQPSVVLDKLDGSMVCPVLLGGHVRWTTKMGITSTAMRAEVFVARHRVYVEFAEYMLSRGCTPIFEWCSRKDRIVLDYPEDTMILTAVRDIYTGEYMSLSAMQNVVANSEDGAFKGIPVVNAHIIETGKDNWQDPNKNDFVTWLRAREDMEGIVVRFADGNMLKVKTEWYVGLHRAKALIDDDRNVVNVIVTDALDDLIGMLDPENAKRVKEFAAEFTYTMLDMSAFVLQQYDKHAHLTKKEFALLPSTKSLDPMVKSIIFRLFDAPAHDDGQIAIEGVKEGIKKSLTKVEKYDTLKKRFNLPNFN